MSPGSLRAQRQALFQRLSFWKGFALYAVLSLLPLAFTAAVWPDARIRPGTVCLLLLAEMSPQLLFVGLLLAWLQRTGIGWRELWGPRPVLGPHLPRLIPLALISGCSMQLMNALLSDKNFGQMYTAWLYWPPLSGERLVYKLQLLSYDGLLMLGSGLLGPCFEEVVFRGWLLHRLALWLPPERRNLALAATGLAGALSHGNNWLGGLCVNLLLSALYLKTGSLGLTLLLNSILHLSLLLFWGTLNARLLPASPQMYAVNGLCGLGLVLGLWLWGRELRRCWPSAETVWPLLKTAADQR